MVLVILQVFRSGLAVGELVWVIRFCSFGWCGLVGLFWWLIAVVNLGDLALIFVVGGFSCLLGLVFVFWLSFGCCGGFDFDDVFWLWWLI